MSLNNNYKIRNGSRVAVVGGGPAGCFFALYLLRYTRQLQIYPEIDIFQDRQFDEPGPRGCKGCAGVLAVSVTRNLMELGLKVPESVIQARIDQYVVHSPYLSLSIHNPEKESEIISIYRGGGPMRADGTVRHVSFDAWLLGETQERGARVMIQKVTEIRLAGKPTLEVDGNSLNYDLVVLATGVNGRDLLISEMDYTPPRTAPAAMMEFFADSGDVRTRIGNAAHAFLIPEPGVLFGSMVPKGSFINVSVLSTGAKAVRVNEFLSEHIVRSVLPEHYARVCSCQPRVPVTRAKRYFRDGFVAIGDAAVSRLHKDGIGSALVTARQAAVTVAHHGFSRADFVRYYHPFCNNLNRDNLWGRGLFFMANRTKNSRVFLFTQHRLIGDEQNDIRKPQPFTRIAWGMFTGAYSYRSMVMTALMPGSLFKFLSTILRESIQMIAPKSSTSPRRLHIGGKRIVILGSGFGGTYALRYLVRALNKNENVETMMVSRDNYFLFVPLLHEVALGGIEPRHIAYPIRRIHQRDRFNLVQAEIEHIDLEQRKVSTTAGDFSYDYLVLSLGGVTDRTGLKSGFTSVFTMRTLRDSRFLRDHIIGTLEHASLEKDANQRRRQLTYIVSGGGYIGVQVVTELRDFIIKNIRKYYRTIPPEDVQILLVEPEPSILTHLDKKLSNFAMNRITRMGIKTRVNSKVTSFGDRCVVLNNKDIVPVDTLIWVVGQVSNPLVADLPVEKDDIGRVKVDQFMEIAGYPGVYAVGDCAHFRDAQTGQPIPPRAHTTVRQAKTAARNILADIRGREKKPYHFSEGGEFVTLGDSSAMLRVGRLRLYGFPARVLWLLTYSLLVTGTYNRMRVMIDWLLSIIFGRQLTYFGYQKE